MNRDSIVAIITARGGSKGLPGKNILPLAGKPLIAYSILAALECPVIGRCLVSTENLEIKRVSLEWGAEVIDRPMELATDTALSQDAVRHVLTTMRDSGEVFEYFVLLQPTSPLRNAAHLTECLHRFSASNCKSAISITEMEHHPFKCFRMEDQVLMPLHDIESLDKPRQFLPKVFRQNGAIYVAHTESFLEENSFFIPPVMPFMMGREESVDIDNAFDLYLTEEIIGSY